MPRSNHLRKLTTGSAIVALALFGVACNGLGEDQADPNGSVESSIGAITAGTVVSYEAESLTRNASSIGSKVTSEAAASGGKYVEFAGTAAANAWVEFTLTNVAAGAYDLKFLFKSNTNRGTVQASIDGANQGSACNEYAGTAAYKVACSLGSKTLTAGSHVIRFTVTGKSASSSGYQLVVDQISMTYTGAGTGTCGAPQFATNPQSFASACDSTAWVTFTASPSSGTKVASYQWYYSYVGSTAANPVLSTDKYRVGGNTQTLQVAPQDSQYVWLVITDTCGQQATSSKALLTVPASPACQCSGSGGTSTAATSIAASKSGPVCAASSVTLTAVGGTLGAGASWVWYTSSAHTTRLGSGASLTVSPRSDTTYYVRAEGTCNTTSDASTTVRVAPGPQIAQNPQSYAAPCNSTAWVNFSAFPSSGTVGATYQWYFSNDDTVPGTAVTSTNRYFMGGTTTTLQVAPQSTRYVWLVVTDVCGATATSTHAQLFVPDSSTCP